MGSLQVTTDTDHHHDGSGIHLYAEYLQNIRTVSIQASLATVSNKATKATLSADGSRLELSHEGETASIQLPIQIPGGHNEATLNLPAAPTKDLSFRLNVQEKPDTDSHILGNGHNLTKDENVMPWTATDLTSQSEICCARCKAVIIARGAITKWKDLPSESWAEMMEFWHCHKPEVSDGQAGGDARGIGVNSKLAIERVIGLVGPLDLIFDAEDCSGVMYKQSDNFQNPPAEDEAICSSCRTAVGVHESATDGSIRLRKAQLSISLNPSTDHNFYATEKWLTAYILENIDSQGIRKFIISSRDTPSDLALNIWVFAPDLTMSSSAFAKGTPTKVVKIVWQDCEQKPSGPEKLNTHALFEGDIELPGVELSELRRLLAVSGGYLPAMGRKFQGWNVGLLRRFVTEDVQGRSAG